MTLRFKTYSMNDLERRPDVVNKIFTFRDGDRWLWVCEGPTYHHVYEVLGPLSDSDLQKLRYREAPTADTGSL